MFPTDKTGDWAFCNLAPRRRSPLALCFDPATTREATQTGRRDRQPGCGQAAIRIWPTMQVLVGLVAQNPRSGARALSASTRLLETPCDGDHSAPQGPQARQARHRRGHRRNDILRAHRNASAGPAGDDGAAVTVEAAQKPGWTAASCWVSACPHGRETIPSTARCSMPPSAAP